MQIGGQKRQKAGPRFTRSQLVLLDVRHRVGQTAVPTRQPWSQLMSFLGRCATNCCVLLFCTNLLSAQKSSNRYDTKIEEIYIIRSVLISHLSGPTDYCAQERTGFADVINDRQFVFYAVTTRAHYGEVVNPMGDTPALAEHPFQTSGTSMERANSRGCRSRAVSSSADGKLLTSNVN